MPQYNPPLRDMQFVMHEVLDVVNELKALPAHADIDADTINAVLEEGGKFASTVIAPPPIPVTASTIQRSVPNARSTSVNAVAPTRGARSFGSCRRTSRTRRG